MIIVLRVFFIQNINQLASQFIRLLVVDVDSGKNVKAEEQEVLGEVECTLAEIITARGSLFNKPLTYGNHKNRGSVIVRSEEVSNSSGIIQFKLSASKLDKKDFFGSSGIRH